MTKLDDALGIQVNETLEVIGTEVAVLGKSDYEVVHENLHELISKTSESMEELIDIAKASQNPTAYSSLSSLAKTVIEANKALLAMNKLDAETTKIKREIKEEESKPTVINNNLFVGSTAELQKFLLENKSA